MKADCEAAIGGSEVDLSGIFSVARGMRERMKILNGTVSIRDENGK